MLPTPSTSHVDFERIYEPAEDSYLLLDTLSSESETAFLTSRFVCTTASSSSVPPGIPNDVPSPLVVEIGTGSGVVLSFVHTNASTILGRTDILTLGVDVNEFACTATAQTISVAEKERSSRAETANEVVEGQQHGEAGLEHGFYLGNIVGDLTSCLRSLQIDILIFNPPYVPTASLPHLPLVSQTRPRTATTYEEDSHLLELSYAGGADGMETTDRLLESLPDVLSEKGCAYVLLCAQNKPRAVMERVGGWKGGWRAESVGSSGMKGGWEKLVVIRIWRDYPQKS